MKLTLWLLNRCVDWESSSPGVMARALEDAGHEVVLAQRVVGEWADGADWAGGTRSNRVAFVNVNESRSSRPGALMHEDTAADAATHTPSYDDPFRTRFRCSRRVVRPCRRCVNRMTRPAHRGRRRFGLSPCCSTP
jgi:hypothetical protein